MHMESKCIVQGRPLIDYKREKSNQMKYLMLSFKITAFFSTKLAWKQNNSQVAESNTRKPKHAS